MKTPIKAAIATASVASVIAVATLYLQDPRKELKAYIQAALINGCKPVIDICTSNCVKDIVYYGPPECLPKEIMRASTKEATEAYVELAEDLKIKVKTIKDFKKMPHKIREELGKVKQLKNIKEDLISEHGLF
jgi:hypothetical protein